MNIYGYYNPDEVWIPDPYLMEKEQSINENQHKEKRETKELNLD